MFVTADLDFSGFEGMSLEDITLLTSVTYQNLAKIFDDHFDKLQARTRGGTPLVTTHPSQVLEHYQACSNAYLDNALSLQQLAQITELETGTIYKYVRVMLKYGKVEQLPLRRNRQAVYAAVGYKKFLEKTLDCELLAENIREIARVAEARAKNEGLGKTTRRRSKVERELTMKALVKGHLTEHREKIESAESLIFPTNTGHSNTTKALVPFTKVSTNETNLIPLQDIPRALEAVGEALKETASQCADAMRYMYVRDLMMFGIPSYRDDKGKFRYEQVEDSESPATNPVGPLNTANAANMMPNRIMVMDWLEVRRDFFKEMTSLLDKLLALPCWDQEGFNETEITSRAIGVDDWTAIQEDFLPVSFLMGSQPIYVDNSEFKEAANRFQEVFAQWVKEQNALGGIERRSAKKTEKALKESSVDVSPYVTQIFGEDDELDDLGLGEFVLDTE